MRPGPSRNADPAGLAVTVARVRAGVPAVGEAGAASNPPGDPPWAPGFFLGNYTQPDRKRTRLNPSHSQISYAAFCLEKNHATDFKRDPTIRAEHPSFYAANPRFHQHYHAPRGDHTTLEHALFRAPVLGPLLDARLLG